MVTTLDVLAGGVLLFSLWAAGEVFSLFRSGLVGQILVGILLGPGLLDYAPYPEAFELIGMLGLLLMVTGAGLHMDLGPLKKVGWRAVAAALTGTLLPIVCGLVFCLALGFGVVEGLASGIALASSSMGMAISLLQQANEMDTPLGSLIFASCMLDDILALVLLSILLQLDDVSALEVIDYLELIGTPIASSVLLFIVGGVAYWLLPLLWRRLWRHCHPGAFRTPQPPQQGEAEHGGDENEPSPESEKRSCSMEAGESRVNATEQENEDQNGKSYQLLVCLLVSAWGLAVIAGLIRTTDLLGAFVAGFGFSRVTGAKNAWDQRIPPLEYWLSGIFFVSIGFVVPVDGLLDVEAIGWGLLFSLISAFAKLATGIWAKPFSDAPILAFALMGRGELGFLMATEALEKGIMGELTFSVTIWALLLNTFIAPFFFGFFLNLKKKRETRYKELNKPSREDALDLELQTIPSSSPSAENVDV